jgi:hypothetical protein
MGCCGSSASHGNFIEINEAEESRVRRIWKEKWGSLARVMHVLRPRSASDSAFGVIVRLYALQVGERCHAGLLASLLCTSSC